MDDKEAFDEFYVKLKNIVNSAFNIGEKIPKKKAKIWEGIEVRMWGRVLFF